jgi:hypothetical protein
MLCMLAGRGLLVSTKKEEPAQTCIMTGFHIEKRTQMEQKLTSLSFSFSLRFDLCFLTW